MFKVGDRVRVIRCRTMGSGCPHLKEIGTITEANTEKCAPYMLDIDKEERWHENELELVERKVQFTKSDLKDGDKCTLKDGRIVYYGGDYESSYNFRALEGDLKYQYNDDVSIVKVERPVQYETVFERKEEILDEAEKRWLDNFIETTGIKVKYIQKWLGASCGNEYLEIEYSNYWSNNEILFLPVFKRNTKYKGMKINKKYTLEELGL